MVTITHRAGRIRVTPCPAMARGRLKCVPDRWAGGSGTAGPWPPGAARPSPPPQRPTAPPVLPHQPRPPHLRLLVRHRGQLSWKIRPQWRKRCPTGYRNFREGRIFHVIAAGSRTTGHSRTTRTGATVRIRPPRPPGCPAARSGTITCHRASVRPPGDNPARPARNLGTRGPPLVLDRRKPDHATRARHLRRTIRATPRS